MSPIDAAVAPAAAPIPPQVRHDRWELVAAHRERVLRLVRSRFTNLQDAEDCTQEALLRTAQFPGLDETRVGAFLTTTALRLCADHYREAGRQQRLTHRLAPVHTLQGPDETVCERDAAAWLLAQAHRLSGRERQVMLGRAEGLSTAEVAAALEITPKAAESAFTRGRTRLRSLYEDEMAGRPTVGGPAARRRATTRPARRHRSTVTMPMKSSSQQ